MPLLPSNFFYKEIGIYIIALCFIPSTEDLKWVTEFSFTWHLLWIFILPLLLFTLPGYCLSWLNCHNFPHSVQDGTFSRPWAFVIWHCVVCSKSLVLTIVHIRVLHAWYCIGAVVLKRTYYLNYKINVSWWMDSRVVIRHMTWKKNDWYKLQRDVRCIVQYLLETDIEEMIVNGT